MTRPSRKHILIAVSAVAAVAVVAAGMFGYRYFDDRRAAESQVEEATKLIEKADESVVLIDGVVGEEVTPELAAKAEEALGQVDDATESVEEALRLLDEAVPNLPERNRQHAELLRSAAEARLEMLEHAPPVLEYNVKAARALPAAEEAWEHTLEAVRLSEKAVESYNKLTKEGVEASAKINKDAASRLASATALFAEAHEAFPEAKLDVFSAYVTARIELTKLSNDSDVAWLAGDLAKANTIINAYNTEDKKAIELAKKLPPNPRQAIAAAYDQASATKTDLYYAARERATKADERLRTF